MLKSIGSCVVYFDFASALKDGVFKYLPDSTTTAGEVEWNCFWLISTRVVRLGMNVWTIRVVHVKLCISKTLALHTRFALADQAGALLFGTTKAMQDSGGCARG